MSDTIKLETQINQAISAIHMVSNPVDRARRAGEMIEYLQGIVNNNLVEIRRRAVAEAVLRPNMSMAKVASELNLSKSTVAKLAAPNVRDAVANDMTTRLDQGYVPGHQAVAAHLSKVARAAFGLGASDATSMQKTLAQVLPKMSSLGAAGAFGLGASDATSMQKTLAQVLPKMSSLGAAGAFGLGAKDVVSMQKILGQVVPKIDFASLGAAGAFGLGAKDVVSMQKILGQVVPKIDFASLGAAGAFGLGAKDVVSMQKILGQVVPKIDFASLGAAGAFGLGAKDVVSMQKILGQVVPKIDFASLNSVLSGALSSSADVLDKALEPDSIDSVEQTDLQSDTTASTPEFSAAVGLVVAITLYVAVLAQHGIVGAVQLLTTLTEFAVSAYGNADQRNPTVHGIGLMAVLLLAVYAANKSRGHKS